ncbi:hypothetical protein AAG570_013739 [Ranatra chinensis]|uniref:Uncharacterized protein n=1 Tax=Ranatra chinensis TaxID=642074 RepID=A0ABD0Z1B4_9HEMI
MQSYQELPPVRTQVPQASGRGRLHLPVPATTTTATAARGAQKAVVGARSTARPSSSPQTQGVLETQHPTAPVAHISNQNYKANFLLNTHLRFEFPRLYQTCINGYTQCLKKRPFFGQIKP